MCSKFTVISDIKIHYKTVGSGPNTLLLIHSAVGSTNDFLHQVEGKFQLSKEFYTLVIPDLPGYGLSGSPDPEKLKVEPSLAYFDACVQICAKLMASLNHKTYSVCGYSDGAKVASLLAVRCQSRVNSLLLWCFIPYMDDESCYAIAKTRDTSAWDPEILDYYSAVYGEEIFSDMWRKYVDIMISNLELPDKFDIRDQLRQIKCPTIVLHGTEDPIVSFEDHVKPAEIQIYDSEVILFKGLSNNIHQVAPHKFNEVLTRLVDCVST